MTKTARILTVAGSDSGGGAGIQADVKTITVLGGYASTAITALTAQNTVGVRAIEPVPSEFVAAQIDAVMEDIGADAAKSGMLYSAEVIETVAAAFRRHGIRNYVLDPVFVSKSGHALLDSNAVGTLKAELLPLAALVTPNVPEAEGLASVSIAGDESVRDAARRIAGCGPKAVLIKGGHTDSTRCVDVLFDGRDFYEFGGERIASKSTHGTGCTLSAAIATFLGMGVALCEAVGRAREFVVNAIRLAPGIGAGWGPLGHLAAAKKMGGSGRT